MSNEMTYGRLTGLLESLGFEPRGSGEYYHGKSDTVFLLNLREVDDVASPVDVVAVRKQLTERGLMEGAEFDQRVGRLRAGS
jgi:hypothetical protein